MQQTLSRQSLIEEFYHYGAPEERWLVGLELERHLLDPAGMPVPYFGDHGVQHLLHRLSKNGWNPYFEGENLIALLRNNASVTLEPGSQFEYSTAPHRKLSDLNAEALTFNAEVDEAIADLPITPVALGYTPVADIDDIAFIPKGRYAVMRDYLGETGPLAHHMMKGTCATQASYDFSNEQDCVDKVRLGTLLGPLTTAMFANSPLTLGEPNGWASFRGYIWTQTDPKRCGFPVATAGFSFEKWVDYLLDTPMMFFYNPESGWQNAKGLTFRAWMTAGVNGNFPTAKDWDLHTTSVFPEVRVKKLIEIRGADCVSHELAIAFAAFFKGLFYSRYALERALALAEEFSSIGSAAERFEIACREGLAGNIGDRRMASFAEKAVEIAQEGLLRIGESTDWLAPLAQQVEKGESPCVDSLRKWLSFEDRTQQIAMLRYHKRSSL